MNYIKFDKFGQQFKLDDIKSIGVREYDVVVILEDCEYPIYSANTLIEAINVVEEYIALVIEKHKQARERD